jgi:hypothetical protein
VLISAVLVCTLGSVNAQPLSVDIHEIRSDLFPVIRLQIGLIRGGTSLPHPGGASFSLLEIGVAVDRPSTEQDSRGI